MKSLIALSMLFSTYAVAADTRLIGGTVVDQAEWPASVYASMGGGRCTATVVGERTLLIAAHCVKNGGSVSFSAGGNKYTGKCKHAPGYAKNSTADWSMCLVDKEVTGIPYENMNDDAKRFAVNDSLTLTGYGCIYKGGKGGNDGKYRIGQAKITRLPSGKSNDIVTKGSAALCFGDSGGPAFHVDSTGRRYVVSVNSRGDIATTSYLSSVTTAEAQDFILGWAKDNNQYICGLHSGAKNCRN